MNPDRHVPVLVLAALLLTVSSFMGCSAPPPEPTRPSPTVVAPAIASSPEAVPTLAESAEARRVSWQKPGAFWRWTWPEEEDFQSIWETWDESTHPWRVLMGDARLSSGAEVQDVVLLSAPSGGALALRLVDWISADDRTRIMLEDIAEDHWYVDGGGLDGAVAGDTLTFRTAAVTGRRFTFTPSYIEPAGSWSEEAFDDWVYTSTLLTFEPKVRQPYQRGGSDEAAEALWRGVPGAGASRFRGRRTLVWDDEDEGTTDEDEAPPVATDPDAAITALLASPDVASSDERWGDLLEYAKAQGNDELQMEVYARWRPMGRCSMDDRPRQAARAYGEVCGRAGRLGCFMQLGVQLLADSFHRMVYSSWAERANGTGIEAIADAGVDTDRLLRGLVLRFSTSVDWPVGSGPHRVARAVVELGHGVRLAEAFEARAQDPTLDDMNRLYAAMTLKGILDRLHESDPDLLSLGLSSRGYDSPRALAHLATLELPPVARRWLAELQTEE